GFGGLLPRLLRHWALLDADQRFAVGAVHDIDPAGATGLGRGLARLAVDDGVEQKNRARRVVVPNVVVHLLEVPGIGAGLGVDREERGAKKIVPFAHRSVVVGPAIADREVDQTELRIERRGVPDRCAAASVMCGANRPGVAAWLAWCWQGVGTPQDFT